jgi:hypothetical protein
MLVEYALTTRLPRYARNDIFYTKTPYPAPAQHAQDNQ